MKKMTLSLVAFVLTPLMSLTASATHHEKVSFESPKSGETVSTTFKVKMGLTGFKVCEANKETNDKKCGHHHLLVDQGPVAKGEVIPKDDNHLHFGKMQTEAEVTLKPGKHKLTLQFADWAHKSMGPAMADTIEITVK